MRTQIGLVAVLFVASSACTAATFVGDDAGAPGDDAGNVPSPHGGPASDAGNDATGDAGTTVDAAPPPGCDETKLPTEDTCVVNDAAGIFASSSLGSLAGPGTKANPFASLDAAIAAAKKANKRVYACAETYAEQVHLADGVDVFGYFACGAGWTVGTAHAKVVAPASPAATASNVTDPTRVEAVDLIAPDFTGNSQSSIGLIADHSPALTIKNATIHAGTGGKGADGVNGVQLSNASGIRGGDATEEHVCVGVLCASGDGGSGGANACVGSSGHDGGPGGSGGSGGYFHSQFWNGKYAWILAGGAPGVGLPATSTPQTAQGGAVALGGSAGMAGADGQNGLSGLDFGTLSAGGYIASDGTAGVSGAPGQGGGGAGAAPGVLDHPAPSNQNDYAWGESGSGGGAGGCPGLAATPGMGGGASLAVVAVQSPLTLDTVVVEASAGGAGGQAGFASIPTSGGAGGAPTLHTVGGGSGGAGGHAGVSGNGGGGPSIGIATQGTPPTQLATTVTVGAGGSGVAARVGNDGKSIPASPNGASAKAYPF